MGELTILAPVYNEEESLGNFKEAMDEFLSESPLRTRVLFINDGSSDGSYAILKDIVQQDPRYMMISLTENCGLSTAMKAGIDHTTTEWVGYIDSDLQTTPMDFLKFMEYLNQADMVTGVRVDRNDGFIKRLSSTIANGVRSRMIGDGIRDTGCPLKIMRTEVAKQIPFFKGMHRFLPALVQLQGKKVIEVPVRHFSRSAGVSKYTLRNRLTGPFFDMLAFMWMKKRNLRYSVKNEEKVPSDNPKVKSL